ASRRPPGWSLRARRCLRGRDLPARGSRLRGPPPRRLEGRQRAERDRRRRTGQRGNRPARRRDDGHRSRRGRARVREGGQKRPAIRETRLRIARALQGETIGDVVRRGGSAWSAEQAAVANEVAPGDVLAGGRPVKVAMTEPYVAGY